MTKLYPKFWIYAAALPALTIALDQASKYWATKSFNVPFNICEINPYIGREGLFREFSPIVDWAMTCNLGVSFGMLGGDSDIKRWVLTAFAFVMCTALLYVLSTAKDTLSRIGIGLIIGGAIGNGIDRLLFGAVTDFISVHELLPFFPWVFNIADSAISVGVAALLIASFIHKPEPKTS